jgi:hypothetical protein
MDCDDETQTVDIDLSASLSVLLSSLSATSSIVTTSSSDVPGSGSLLSAVVMAVLESVLSHELYTHALIPLPLPQLLRVIDDKQQLNRTDGTEMRQRRPTCSDRRLFTFATELTSLLQTFQSLVDNLCAASLASHGDSETTGGTLPLQTLRVLFGPSLHNAKRQVHIHLPTCPLPLSLHRLLLDRSTSLSVSQKTLTDRIRRSVTQRCVARAADEPLSASPPPPCCFFLAARVRTHCLTSGNRPGPALPALLAFQEDLRLPRPRRRSPTPVAVRVTLCHNSPDTAIDTDQKKIGEMVNKAAVNVAEDTVDNEVKDRVENTDTVNHTRVAGVSVENEWGWIVQRKGIKSLRVVATDGL